MQRTLRFSAVAGLLLLSFVLSAAKCIENDSLRRGSDGDWHIYGEIHNETDVQGSEMIVVGTLLDANGSVLATAQTPICPFELSPDSFSIYDVDFHNSQNIPQPASYKINVMSGKVLEEKLPPLDLTLSGLQAERDGDTVTITGSVRANENYPGQYQGCAAFYDASGDVVMEWTIFGFGELPASVTQPLELPLSLTPADAVSVRLWIVGPGPATQPLSSSYRAVMSNMIPIE